MRKKYSFFAQFGIGVKSYGGAVSLVVNNGLWIYFIYPVIIYVLLFWMEITFVDHLFEIFKDKITNAIIPSSSGSDVAAFVNGTIHSFLWIGLHILFFIISYLIGKYIVLILMSPVMAILSERTEAIITGKKYPFDLTQFIKDIARGITIAFRNLFIQLAIILLSCIVLWIPVIGWICPVFLVVVSWYFYGFSMIDYRSERSRLNVEQSIEYMRTHKGLAIGNGCIFSLIFAIPFVGVILSSVLSPVAACIAVLETEK